MNIASRLEKVAKDLHQGIIVSEQTVQRLRPGHQGLGFLAEVPIRGRNEPVRVYGRA